MTFICIGDLEPKCLRVKINKEIKGFLKVHTTFIHTICIKKKHGSKHSPRDQHSAKA